MEFLFSNKKSLVDIRNSGKFARRLNARGLGTKVAVATFFVFGASLIGVQIAAADTTINISPTIDVGSVIPMGINLGTPDYYDSGQMMKNLISVNNPGFEGQMYSNTARCASGTPTSCTDDDPWSGLPSGFWNGATYTFIYGTAKGRTGTITMSVKPGSGTTYNFGDSGITPAVGDIILIEKKMPGTADFQWRKTVSGNATDSTDFTDLSPTTAGTQALEISAPATSDNFDLYNLVDTWSGKSFITMNGTYQVTFSAKQLTGTKPINVTVERLSSPANIFVNQNVQLSNTWQTYTVTFNANENGSQNGFIELSFDVNAATVLLDDVTLEKTSGDPTNTTAFRDEVVDALKQYHPGTLRDWVGQLGDTIDNQLEPDLGMQTAQYSAFNGTQGGTFNLEDFLELCQAVGADPWYVMPITTTPQDMQNLIQFLAGPVTTPYGAKRAAFGHPAPWTQAFNTIHLEFGNEAWNGTFKGGTIEYPQAYGTRANEIFAAAKSSPNYVPSKFDLIMGGQFVNVGRNTSEQSYDTNNDSVDVAPYFGTSLATDNTTNAIFAPMLAEGEMNSLPTGFMGQNVAQLSKPVEIYEDNIDASYGVSQSVAQEQKPSLGAGLALANNSLLYLRDDHVKVQNIWALSQYDFSASGVEEPIWGITVDMGNGNVKRPQFYAMQLVNQAIGAAGTNMLTTTQSGDNPTWSVNNENGVTIPNAHDIQSYAFSNGTTQSLVLFNLSLTSSLNVNFSGANTPQGTVTQTRLTSANISDNNENGTVVAPVTTVLNNFSPTQSYALPPYSETVLSWGGSGTTIPVTTPTSTPAGDTTAPTVPAGLSATGSSSSQITLSWTASTDNVGVAGYNIYRNGVQISSANTPSYADSALSAGTTYIYTVSAYDAAGNVSAQSASASGTTLPPASTKFTTGERVVTTAALNVRSSASLTGTILGTEPVGTVGTVTGGPTAAGGYNWWQVSFGSLSGWSVEDYLQQQPAAGASADGTTIPNASQIVDVAGNTWTVSAGVIYENGVTAGYSSNVSLLLLYGGTIYQENTAGGWWSWSNGGWNAVTGDPRGSSGSGNGNSGGGATPPATTTTVTTNPSVNGVCSATSKTCTVGTVVNISDNGTTTGWSCLGSNGGTTASCSVVDVSNTNGGNGVCGPVVSTCSVGSVVNNYDSGTKTEWDCLGSNGGATQWCVVLDPGNPGNASCGTTVKTCNTGSLSNVYDSGVTTTWACLGSDGGTNASCSAADNGSSGSGITTSNSTKFTIGETVVTTAALNIRSSASLSGTITGTKSPGAVATVIGGPIAANGYNWWEVNFAGFSGWSVEDYLAPTQPTTPVTTPIVPTSTPITPTSTPVVSTVDSTPPTVSISSPTSGATVSGASVAITVSASDNVGVTKTQFYVDGVMIGVDSSAPFTFTWNTNSASNGNHTLVVKAYDAAGNVGNSASVNVTVNNNVSTPVTTPTTPTSTQGGLSAWWRFDELSGGVAADSTGDGNTGILIGGYTHVGGILSNAITFNGSTGYMYNSVQSPNPQTLSLATWFKTTTTSGGDLIGFSAQATGFSSQYDRLIYMTNSGQLEFGVAPSGAPRTIQSPLSYNDGNWHLAVATLASDGMKLYVDGALVASNSSVTSAQGYYNGYWRIGYVNLTGWPNMPLSSYFAGTIDDARVYSSELLSSNIQQLFAAGGATSVTTPAPVPVPTTPTSTATIPVVTTTPTSSSVSTSPSVTAGLAAWWKLDEGSGSIAGDSSGNDDTGSLTGAYTWTTGIMGGAISFPGSTGQIASNDYISGPQVFSLSTWFKTTTTQGGEIMGFGNNQGQSQQNDRHLYMANNGQIFFGVFPGGYKVISSPLSYNDGQWHLVVATLASDGMKLYVDGALVASNSSVTAAQSYNGYWKAGGNSLASWPSNPSSMNFAGTLDDIRIFNRELSASEVSTLEAGVQQAAVNPISTSQLATIGQAFNTSNADLEVTIQSLFAKLNSLLTQLNGR